MIKWERVILVLFCAIILWIFAFALWFSFHEKENLVHERVTANSQEPVVAVYPTAPPHAEQPRVAVHMPRVITPKKRATVPAPIQVGVPCQRHLRAGDLLTPAQIAAYAAEYHVSLEMVRSYRVC